MLKVFDNQYRVNYNDSDYTGRLSIAKLGNYILDTAGLHAIELGISMHQLAKRNLTWVISGMYFSFSSLPKVNSMVVVKTFVKDFSKIACKRDFIVTTENGEKIAEASSQWLVINTITRRPVFLDEVFPSFGEIVNLEEKKVEKNKHLRFSFSNPSAPFKYKVMYSDIDINTHLYSMRYLELSLDVLGKDFFSEYRILSADINFISEVLYNQDVEIYLEEPSNDIRQVEMIRDGSPVFRVEFKIEKITN